ncbi:hypothetical protein BGZ73_000634 [Actinomortierella ambigua]|nr:hypothetical protein BGZ73_000634 [Actinomortierella ambigua]
MPRISKRKRAAQSNLTRANEATEIRHGVLGSPVQLESDIFECDHPFSTDTDSLLSDNEALEMELEETLVKNAFMRLQIPDNSNGHHLRSWYTGRSRTTQWRHQKKKRMMEEDDKARR